jgi:hypothetical protein
MRDYFAEFILGPKTQAAPLGSTPNLGILGHTLEHSSMSKKHHILWALTATAVAVASWKVSQWRTSHKFLKNNQAEG